MSGPEPEMGPSKGNRHQGSRSRDQAREKKDEEPESSQDEEVVKLQPQSTTKLTTPFHKTHHKRTLQRFYKAV